MKKILFGMLILHFISCHQKENLLLKLKSGDLLFKDTQNDSIASAIKEVTPSSQDYSFSHVGILFRENNEWFVLEAVPGAGVRIVSLEVFRTPEKGKIARIVVGRLKKEYPFDLKQLIAYGKSQVGKKYDSAFIWNSNAFYCSELVYQMFANAGQSKAFLPKPMTFKEKGTTSFHPTWIRYYEKLGQEIPEGKIGINPNAMANSKSVNLLFEIP